MRSLRLTKFGTPDVLEVADIPDPVPDTGNVLVKIMAASINPSDVKNVAGAFNTALPRTPGRDYAGVVAAGPDEWLGKRVFGCGGWDLGFAVDGTHAQYIAVPAQSLTEIPLTLDFRDATTLGVTFVTALHGLSEAGGVTPGEVVAVIGAQGGVGSAVVQIAKSLGAVIIAIDRKPVDPEHVIAHLVDHAINISQDDPVDKVLEITGKLGANLVYNAVGGPLLEIGLRLLSKRGRQIAISSVGERRVSFDLVDFYHKQAHLIGVDSMSLDSNGCGVYLKEIAAMVTSGTITVPQIDSHVYSLETATQAYEQMSSGRSDGRVVLMIGQ